MFDSRLFATSEDGMSADWVAHIEPDGMVQIGPPEWMASGFWESFFDGEPVAVRAYEDRLKARP